MFHVLTLRTFQKFTIMDKIIYNCERYYLLMIAYMFTVVSSCKELRKNVGNIGVLPMIIRGLSYERAVSSIWLMVVVEPLHDQ